MRLDESFGFTFDEIVCGGRRDLRLCCCARRGGSRGGTSARDPVLHRPRLGAGPRARGRDHRADWRAVRDDGPGGAGRGVGGRSAYRSPRDDLLPTRLDGAVLGLCDRGGNRGRRCPELRRPGSSSRRRTRRGKRRSSASTRPSRSKAWWRSRTPTLRSRSNPSCPACPARIVDAVADAERSIGRPIVSYYAIVVAVPRPPRSAAVRPVRPAARLALTCQSAGPAPSELSVRFARWLGALPVPTDADIRSVLDRQVQVMLTLADDVLAGRCPSSECLSAGRRVELDRS